MEAIDVLTSETSYNSGFFAISLGIFLVGFLVLHTETPYSQVGSSLNIFRAMWISASFMVSFSLGALSLLVYAREILSYKPQVGHFIQKISVIFLLLSIFSFLISFCCLVWGYAVNSELLHLENVSQTWILFLSIVFTVLLGPIIIAAAHLYVIYVRRRSFLASNHEERTALIENGRDSIRSNNNSIFYSS